jgi:hypothetical protein
LDVDDVLPEGEEDIGSTSLRRLLTEYDRSSPPVQPPIPFDLPKLPSMTTLDPRHNDYASKIRQKAESRKLHGHEITLLLEKSHNIDSNRSGQFVQAFQAFEQKEAKSRTAQEIADQRCGYWLFIYVVLQALPMLVIDAPGLRNTDGIEYFLCQPPKGGSPWVEDAVSMQKIWYGVSGSSSVVAMPSDLLDHGVEAIYRRSHCWVSAEKWLEAGQGPPNCDHQPHHTHQDRGDRFEMQQPTLSVQSPTERQCVEAGPTVTITENTSSLKATTWDNGHNALPRTRTRAHSASHRRSIAFGLEQLPIPPGYDMSPHPTPKQSPSQSPILAPEYNQSEFVLSPNSARRSPGSVEALGVQGKSFDDILQSVEKERGKKDKLRSRRSFIGLGI